MIESFINLHYPSSSAVENQMLATARKHSALAAFDLNETKLDDEIRRRISYGKTTMM